MNKTIKRVIFLALAGLMLLPVCLPAFAAEERKQATILFTHDLYSHFLPSTNVSNSASGLYRYFDSPCNPPPQKEIKKLSNRCLSGSGFLDNSGKAGRSMDFFLCL